MEKIGICVIDVGADSILDVANGVESEEANNSKPGESHYNFNADSRGEYFKYFFKKLKQGITYNYILNNFSNIMGK